LTTQAGPAVQSVNLLTSILTDLDVNQILGMTVVRSILDFKIVTGAAGFYTVGMIVVQSGGAAALNPSTNEHADWMYWRSIQNVTTDTTNAGWREDLHSMRRIDEVEEDLLLSFISETAGDVLAYSASILVKLP